MIIRVANEILTDAGAAACDSMGSGDGRRQLSSRLPTALLSLGGLYNGGIEEGEGNIEFSVSSNV